jgi:hypothetical protein
LLNAFSGCSKDECGAILQNIRRGATWISYPTWLTAIVEMKVLSDISSTVFGILDVKEVKLYIAVCQ